MLNLIRFGNSFLVIEEFPLGARLSIVNAGRKNVLSRTECCYTDCTTIANALKYAQEKWGKLCPRDVIILSPCSLLFSLMLPSTGKLNRKSLHKLLEGQVRNYISENESSTPLGTILLRHKLLEAQDLEDILTRQKHLSQNIHAAPLRFGEIATQEGFCTREDIQAALKLQKQQKQRFDKFSFKWTRMESGAVVCACCDSSLLSRQKEVTRAGMKFKGLYPLYGCSCALHEGDSEQWFAEAADGNFTAINIIDGKLGNVLNAQVVYPTEDIADIFGSDKPSEITLCAGTDFNKEKWEEAFSASFIKPNINIEHSTGHHDFSASGLSAAMGATAMELGRGRSIAKLLCNVPKFVDTKIAACVAIALLFPLLAALVSSQLHKTAKEVRQYQNATQSLAEARKKLSTTQQVNRRNRKSIDEAMRFFTRRQQYTIHFLNALSELYGSGITVDEVYEDLSGNLHLVGNSQSIAAIEASKKDFVKGITGYSSGEQLNPVVLQNARSTSGMYPYHLLFRKTEK